jgi:hypothetical protein
MKKSIVKQAIKDVIKSHPYVKNVLTKLQIKKYAQNSSKK